MTTRRDLLKAVAAVGGAILLGGPSVVRIRGQGEAAAPTTRAYHWRDPAAAGALAAQSALGERTYTSAVYRAPGVFNAVGSLWTGQVGNLELRASADGSTWTAWHVVDTHEYETMGRARDGRASGDLFTGWNWRYAQYRMTSPAGQPAPDVELVLIDSSEGPSTTGPVAPESVSALGISQPYIISRAGWGCDERLRFDSSGNEIWPPDYRVVQKGIVHHTDTRNDYTDAAAEVRGIYYYHAVIKVWGDIGYNYLVDKWGNIYEGRYGGWQGDQIVVGGHALQYNWGSVGVACIGTFGPGGGFVGVWPSAEMKNGLARIVAWTCRTLDPHGSSYFVDRDYPNILGHRDVLPTACPGDYLYAYLPTLRDVVGSIIGPVAPKPAARIDGVAFIPTRLPEGSTLRVEVTVTNVGTDVMPTQGPGPGYTYQEGQDYRAAGYPEVHGAFRVGIDFDGNGTGVDHPYRWGLPGPLAPGQSVKVVGYIKLPSLQKRNYWAGIVDEGVQWWVQQTGVTFIKVLPAFCFTSAGAETAPTPQTSVAPAGPYPYKLYLPFVSKSPCD